jgi:hypothetical protein
MLKTRGKTHDDLCAVIPNITSDSRRNNIETRYDYRDGYDGKGESLRFGMVTQTDVGMTSARSGDNRLSNTKRKYQSVDARANLERVRTKSSRAHLSSTWKTSCFIPNPIRSRSGVAVSKGLPESRRRLALVSILLTPASRSENRNDLSPLAGRWNSVVRTKRGCADGTFSERSVNGETTSSWWSTGK